MALTYPQKLALLAVIGIVSIFIAIGVASTVARSGNPFAALAIIAVGAVALALITATTLRG